MNDQLGNAAGKQSRRHLARVCVCADESGRVHLSHWRLADLDTRAQEVTQARVSFGGDRREKFAIKIANNDFVDRARLQAIAGSGHA